MTPFKVISRNILIMNDDFVEKIVNTEPFGEQDNVDSPVRVFWETPSMKSAPEIRRRILSAIASEQMSFTAKAENSRPPIQLPFDPDKASKFKAGRQGFGSDYQTMPNSSRLIGKHVKPKKDWLIDRFGELRDAIVYRSTNGISIEDDLLYEYNDLIDTLWPNEKKDVNEGKG